MAVFDFQGLGGLNERDCLWEINNRLLLFFTLHISL
jgi:hypothetical protein